METILAAVDGSAYTEVVVRHAAELARIAGAGVLAAYVVDVRLVAGPLASVLADELTAGNREEIARRLSDALQRHGRAGLVVAETICAQEGVRANTAVEHGWPAEVLAAMAPLYDLAVVGSLGWDAQLGTRPIGATAAELLRLATRPVMLVREEYRPVRHVLIGYDGSPEASRALGFVAGLAKAGGWQVTVATVGPNKSREEQLRAQIDRLEDIRHVACEVTLVRGTPDKALLDLVAQLPADLVVVGSRGASKRGRRLVGGTTEAVCRYAPVPVLVYR